MDDEWQDDLWDYAQGGDLYDEDEYRDEDEPREEQEDGEEDEKDFGREEIETGEEEIEFAPDYKQLQQVSSDRRSALRTVGLSEGLQKSQRSPEEATLDQVEGVLSSSYSDLSEVLRQKIISFVEKIKNVYLYNVDVLVLASIWIVEGRKMDKATFQAFLSKYKDRANPLDLLRYIRTFTTK